MSIELSTLIMIAEMLNQCPDNKLVDFIINTMQVTDYETQEIKKHISTDEAILIRKSFINNVCEQIEKETLMSIPYEVDMKNYLTPLAKYMTYTPEFKNGIIKIATT